jgi:heavy-metal resistance protein
MMFNRSKAWAAVLLAAVFVAGGAAGWGVARWGDPRGRHGGGPEGMVRYLDDELHLSNVQKDSVRAILVRHRPEMEALWREVHPRFDSIRAVIRTEISAQLTPGQRQGYLRLIEEQEHQRQKQDSANGGKK